MFPYDAVTKYGEFNTTSSTFSNTVINSNLFDTSDRTILYARIWTDSVSASDKFILGCGTSASDANTTEILSINGRQFASTSTPRTVEVWGNILCDQSLYAFNTVNNTAEYHYQVTYLPYNINTSTSSVSYLSVTKNTEFILITILVFCWLFFVAMIYNKIFKKIG